MTKLKLGVISSIVVAGAVTPLLVQHESLVKLREENQSLRLHIEQQASLFDEREGQAKPQPSDGMRSNSITALPGQQFHELLRLRGEVGILRKQVAEAAKLETRIREVERAANGPQGIKWVTVDTALLELKAKVDAAKQREEVMLINLKVPEAVSRMEVASALGTESLRVYWPYFEARKEREDVETFGSVLVLKLIADAKNAGVNGSGGQAK